MRAVVFTLVVVLGVMAVVGYALLAHRSDDDVHLTVPTPEPTSTPAVSGSPLPPTGPVPIPSPQTVTVGAPICEPKDYHLTRTVPTDDPHATYVLNATYVGRHGSCLLGDYPVTTVKPPPGKAHRYLGPAGGVVRGYGQPQPAKLSRDSPVHANLLVDKSPDCARVKKHETLHDLRMQGVLIAARLTPDCQLRESYWLTNLGQTLGNGPSANTCRVYDLMQRGKVTEHRGAYGIRYAFTVVNRSESDCLFVAFPHLTAERAGVRREISNPEEVAGPQRILNPGKTATSYLQTPRVCRGTRLEAFEVEGVKLFDADKHALGLRECTLTQSYWTLSR